MEFEIDRVFDHAHEILSTYCNEYETTEDCLMRYFPKEQFVDPATIFEFRIKPFEVPIYVICCRNEYTVHMLAATRKDAANTGNFGMIDEIDSFRKKQTSHN